MFMTLTAVLNNEHTVSTQKDIASIPVVGDGFEIEELCKQVTVSCVAGGMIKFSVDHEDFNLLCRRWG